MRVRGRTRAYVVVLVGLLCAAPSFGQTPHPLRGETQANTFTTFQQIAPSVSIDASGRFVVVWTSYLDPGDPFWSVQGQRFESNGTDVGGQFQVNTYTTGIQGPAAVASEPDGDFVVVWESVGGVGNDTTKSIQGRRFQSDGTALGGDFQINTYTTGAQVLPDVAVDDIGNFVVVWASAGSAGSDTSSYSIQGQRFDASGVAQGAEFQINSYTTGSQGPASVAANEDGNFVVVWASLGSAGYDTSGYSIQGQRFESSGAAQGSEFEVNTYTTANQIVPTVGANAAGDFVVVWASQGSDSVSPPPDTDSFSVQAQRFDSNGASAGSQFQVNTYTTGVQGPADISVGVGASFVVVWASQGVDMSQESVQGQRFDPVGTPVGDEFQINTSTTGRQYGPSVAVDGNGDFVVAWQSDVSLGDDSSRSSIQFQRMEPVPALPAPGTAVLVGLLASLGGAVRPRRAGSRTG